MSALSNVVSWPGLAAAMVKSRLGRRFAATLMLALAGGAALAQQNEIEAITANQQGTSLIVKISMKNAPTATPIGFAISNPPRIALDFGETGNATGKNVLDVNVGDLRSINVVQAGPRSRLVLNMNRSLNYAAAIDGKAIVVTIEGNLGTPAKALGANGLALPEPTRVANPAAATAAAAPFAPGTPVGRQLLRDMDFRRGNNGEGRIVVDLPNSQVAVDVRQQGGNVIVDFLRTGLPDTLRRRLDVTDFGTPVKQITTVPQGENVRMTIAATGLWEQSVYQSETQLVIDVKPIKEDTNKLVQGSQGYRGEKVSFNFQNVEVRAVLQAIADISGLNIITSESVTGNLTLRLKEVPWDQALDVVMRIKGLDMRKNGTVVLIAPKEELLTKEKLELEQMALIADLEPLKSEVFQLNYQKAASFNTVFGLSADGSSTGGGTNDKNRVLSKRGSAIVDTRTNQLFVTDIASKLEDIRKLIAKTDVASRQVLIEARIVEASDSFSRNLGVKLGVTNVNGSTGVGGTITDVGAGNNQTVNKSTGIDLTSSNFVSLPAAAINGASAASVAVSLFSAGVNRFLNLELSALEADGTGKIISSPRVVTADNELALIEQGVEIPYQEASSSGATTVSFKKANLSLQVTPQITPDGNIVMTLDVNKDSVGDTVVGGVSINTKHVKSQVMIENGGTVMMGGIYTQTESDTTDKVPLLGDLPVLGYLFRSNAKVNNKTELLVFITPKIMDPKLTAH